MLYIGLLVGAMLGICISMIFLVIVKERAIKAEFAKKAIDLLQQNPVEMKEKKILPSFLARLSSRGKETLSTSESR